MTSFRDLFTLCFYLCYLDVFELQINNSVQTQKERTKERKIKIKRKKGRKSDKRKI